MFAGYLQSIMQHIAKFTSKSEKKCAELELEIGQLSL